MTGKSRFLYVLAPSYSGSTLLTYLLARHPQIATIGELKATQMGDVDRYKCSCGDPIVECHFWRQVADECATEGIPFDVHDFGTALATDAGWSGRLIRTKVRAPWIESLRRVLLTLSPSARRRLDQRITRNWQLSNIITKIQGGRIFVDGSKDATRLLHFINSRRWDVSVLYLQRNGMGVSRSIAKHEGIGFDKAAELWRTNVENLEAMRRLLPDGLVKHIKYEDLCLSTEKVLKDVFSWLKIEDFPIETTDFKNGEFHILGNSMRLGGLSEVRIDERWRTELDAEMQNAFQKRHSRLNAALGYS
jgi:hypothetical protein